MGQADLPSWILKLEVLMKRNRIVGYFCGSNSRHSSQRQLWYLCWWQHLESSDISVESSMWRWCGIQCLAVVAAVSAQLVLWHDFGCDPSCAVLVCSAHFLSLSLCFLVITWVTVSLRTSWFRLLWEDLESSSGARMSLERKNSLLMTCILYRPLLIMWFLTSKCYSLIRNIRYLDEISIYKME